MVWTIFGGRPRLLDRLGSDLGVRIFPRAGDLVFLRERDFDRVCDLGRVCDLDLPWDLERAWNVSSLEVS